MATKITSIEFYVLQAGEEKRPHWVSLFKVPSANELLVRMKTSDGVEGFGLATSYTDIRATDRTTSFRSAPHQFRIRTDNPSPHPNRVPLSFKSLRST